MVSGLRRRLVHHYEGNNRSIMVDIVSVRRTAFYSRSKP
ncbi:MAG: hypothetical protein IJL25_10035 [Clostridia bacterium]|nr:hypothetical protein [Clostridia bacterium]